ncbi:MAG TPA: hypothetical protein VF828_04435 [Patescibacteria group bacterium]
MKNKWLIPVAVVGLTGVLTAVKINYPPTEEQLSLMNFFNIYGEAILWIIRMFSLGMLGVMLALWKNVLDKAGAANLAKFSIIIIAASPSIFGCWMMYPMMSLKLLAMTGIIFLAQKFRMNISIVIAVWALIIGLWGYNNINKPEIFNKIKLTNAQEEVTNRFTQEDSILERIEIPLVIRRSVYNKYFFMYRDILKEAIPFLDMETVFFQEVNPLQSKSLVIFFWPEVVLFLLGIAWMNRTKNIDLGRIIKVTATMAFIGFIFSNRVPYLSFLMLILPLSLVIATGAENLFLFAKEGYQAAKIGLAVLVFLCVYGFGTNFYDLAVRYDYWLDNRPIAYGFIFKSLKNKINEGDNIQVSTLVGNPQNYCKFYLGNKCSQVIFNGFELKNTVPDKGTWYGGFLGEFIGPAGDNQFGSNWRNLLAAKGLTATDCLELRDSIAYKFGNYVIVAKSK